MEYVKLSEVTNELLDATPDTRLYSATPPTAFTQYITAPNLLKNSVAKAGDTMSGQLNFTGTDHAGSVPISLTTPQRDALTPELGMFIYNTTDSQFQGYDGNWGQIGGGGGGTPGGVAGNVQFNDIGEFGGFGNWDGSALSIGKDLILTDQMDAGPNQEAGKIAAITTNPGVGLEATKLSLQTRSGGGTLAEKWSIQPEGYLFGGTASGDGWIRGTWSFSGDSIDILNLVSTWTRTASSFSLPIGFQFTQTIFNNNTGNVLLTGGQFLIISRGSNDLGSLTGLRLAAQHNDSRSSKIVGISSELGPNTGTAVSTYSSARPIIGMVSYCNPRGASGNVHTINIFRGYDVDYLNAQYATIINHYGYYHSSWSTFAGLIYSNVYGLYFEDIDFGSSINYSLYTNAGDISFNSGNGQCNFTLKGANYNLIESLSSDDSIRIANNAGAKFAMFGAPPVVQPSATGETIGFTGGTGTPVNDDSTFTGNIGSTAYRINDIVKALKSIGALAQ